MINDFIKSSIDNSRVYIHYTPRKDIAELILKEGFKYTEGLYQTAFEISGDDVELNYKLQLYRLYGDFLIVFCIPKILYNYAIEKLRHQNIHVLVEVLINTDNFNESNCYILPAIFIQGYINFEKNTIVKNNNFMKNFNIEFFKNVIDNNIMKYNNQ